MKSGRWCWVCPLFTPSELASSVISPFHHRLPSRFGSSATSPLIPHFYAQFAFFTGLWKTPCLFVDSPVYKHISWSFLFLFIPCSYFLRSYPVSISQSLRSHPAHIALGIVLHSSGSGTSSTTWYLYVSYLHLHTYPTSTSICCSYRIINP